ncbi:hypothetical protein [Nonomuraea sp. NPDC049750]|uniref:hypothetical protein n=1 Tax=Nonomuraea sp. NPDC049750 TaxID=3154738 RepID=UPI00340BAFE2
MTTIGEANAIQAVLRYILGWSIESDAAEGSAGYLAQRAQQALGTGLSRDEVSVLWRRLTYIVEVGRERDRQWRRMGGMTPPDGTGTPELREAAGLAMRAAYESFRDDGGSWVAVLNEAVAKAFAEDDLVVLRERLVIVAAHVLCWIEAIDRREHSS